MLRLVLNIFEKFEWINIFQSFFEFVTILKIIEYLRGFLNISFMVTTIVEVGNQINTF